MEASHFDVLNSLADHVGKVNFLVFLQMSLIAFIYRLKDFKQEVHPLGIDKLDLPYTPAKLWQTIDSAKRAGSKLA